MLLWEVALRTITFVINSSQRASLVELHRCGGGHGEPRGHSEASSGQTWGDVAGCKEVVRLQLSDGGPLGGIGVQHPLDKRGRGRVDVLQRRLEIQVIKRSEEQIGYKTAIRRRNIMRCISSAYPRDGVVVFLDAVVGLLQTGGLERGLTHQQSVPERTQTVSTDCAKSCRIAAKLFPHVCFCIQTYNIHPSDQMSTS